MKIDRAFRQTQRFSHLARGLSTGSQVQHFDFSFSQLDNQLVLMSGEERSKQHAMCHKGQPLHHLEFFSQLLRGNYAFTTGQGESAKPSVCIPERLGPAMIEAPISGITCQSIRGILFKQGRRPDQRRGIRPGMLNSRINQKISVTTISILPRLRIVVQHDNLQLPSLRRNPDQISTMLETKLFCLTNQTMEEFFLHITNIEQTRRNPMRGFMCKFCHGMAESGVGGCKCPCNGMPYNGKASLRQPPWLSESAADQYNA